MVMVEVLKVLDLTRVDSEGLTVALLALRSEEDGTTITFEVERMAVIMEDLVRRAVEERMAMMVEVEWMSRVDECLTADETRVEDETSFGALDEDATRATVDEESTR